MNHGKITSEEARSRGYEREVIAKIQLDEEANVAAAALISMINEAFDGVPLPRITLRVARGYDDEWNLTEARGNELRALDPEERWQDVSDEAIQAYQEYFTFSDDEGWRFYLPAFMCHYLRNFPNCAWHAVYDACENQRYIKLLDETQMECMQKFRDLCIKYEEH